MSLEVNGIKYPLVYNGYSELLKKPYFLIIVYKPGHFEEYAALTHEEKEPPTFIKIADIGIKNKDHLLWWSLGCFLIGVLGMLFWGWELGLMIIGGLWYLYAWNWNKKPKPYSPINVSSQYNEEGQHVFDNPKQGIFYLPIGMRNEMKIETKIIQGATKAEIDSLLDSLKSITFEEAHNAFFYKSTDPNK